MEIDIISYKAVQFAALTTSGVREIRTTQLRKNKLLRQLDKNLKKERNSLLKKGIFDSCIWEQIQSKMQAECNAQIEELRESLLFYLEYIAKTKVDVSKVPYNVDYALSFEERYVQVKNYYLTTYTEANARFGTFILDTFAPAYLGELYSMLYDELALLANV